MTMCECVSENLSMGERDSLSMRASVKMNEIQRVCN